MRARRTSGWIGAAVLLALLAISVPAAAGAKTLAPKRGTAFFGVTDRGSTAEFEEFEGLVGKHPAVLETFHPYGNTLNEAILRWEQTEVRPMLHISTGDDQTLAELITPEQIARGAGDDYLLQLNHAFVKHDLPAYVRPLGEPNRCVNPYSAVWCDGSLRGGEHSAAWYRQAFRRIAIIVRGGGPRDSIDARLQALGMPRLHRSRGRTPRKLPAAPVSIVWSPLPAGSPRVAGNFPGDYWPGRRFVDWVGTDLYSAYPVWHQLNRFFRQKRYRGMPFALTEWAVAGVDDPGFARRIFAWSKRHQRVRMLIYYRGFGEDGNPFRLGLYPQTASVIRRQLRRKRFPAFAPQHAQLPSSADKR
jgi:hypothetical protein